MGLDKGWLERGERAPAATALTLGAAASSTTQRALRLSTAGSLRSSHVSRRGGQCSWLVPMRHPAPRSLHRSPRPDKIPKIETDWNVKFDGFLTEAICKGERSA